MWFTWKSTLMFEHCGRSQEFQPFLCSHKPTITKPINQPTMFNGPWFRSQQLDFPLLLQPWVKQDILSYNLASHLSMCRKTGPISIETAAISMDFHLIFWSPRKCSVLGIKGSVSTNSGYSITSSNHLSTDMSISRETNRGKPCLNAIQCFKIVLLHMSKVAAMVESLSGKGPKIYWANCNTEAQVVSFGHTSILCKPTACRRWSTCICKKTW